MDLISVREIRTPRTRAELTFGPGDKPLGGGSWLYSEPQAGFDTLVDLTALGWPEVDETDDALTLAATCPIRTVAGFRDRYPVFWQCANSLLASFKIWNTATIGGNICISLPAGPMTSLASALDAVGVIWSPSTSSGTESERRVPIAEFVTGVRSNVLEHGEVLRAIEFPRYALEARTAFRRIALAELGRSGALVIGRLDAAGQFVLSVTAATTHPWVLRWAATPASGDVAAALDTIDDWYDDPHGAPDWREAMVRRFAEEIRVELS